MFKKTTTLLLLFVLISNAITYGQTDTKTANNLIESDFFHSLDIEKFYIHTNKNNFFSGENIWFKAYIVYDNTNLPSLNTTNVYLNLFSKEGELIESKLFWAENGYTYGEFPINKELESGTYYFQIGTNYSLNFNHATSQKISIINLAEKQNKTLITENSEQDGFEEVSELSLNFFPEANSLVENIPNKIITQFNVNAIIEGDIIDTKNNKKVSHFKSDKDGIASLFLLYNSNYKAVVNYKNTTYNFSLPIAKTKGFNILKTRETATTTDFIIKANSPTISDYSNKTMFAVLHRKGAVKSIAPITVKSNQKDYVLKFLSNDLYDGLNTITLFDEQNRTVVERHFYKAAKTNNFKITKNGIQNDSLVLGFLPEKGFKNANISISIHHKDFIAYNNKTGIISQLGVAKYLPINAFNFNEAISNKNTWKVDNYLQILSANYKSYPYKAMAENSLIFKNENGLTISGSLNTKIDKDKNYSVLLTSKDNNLFLMTKLNKDKSFKFENIYLTHPSNYQLALMNNKGKMISSNFVIFKNYTNYNPSLSINNLEKAKTKLQEDNSILKELDYLEFMNFDNVTQLDEVTISKDQTDETIEKDRKLKNNGIIGEAFSKSYKIDDSAYNDLTIDQYVQTLSGVTLQYNNDGSTSLINERFIQNFSNEGPAVFTISLDGIPQGTDFTIMSFRRIKEFDYVLVNHRGAGYGSNFAKGIITFVSKKGDNTKYQYRNKKIKYFESEIGFNEAALKFETPLLNYGTAGNKNKLSNLDWLPNEQFTEDQIKYIKVNSHSDKDLLLIINGFNSKGQLINQVIKL